VASENITREMHPRFAAGLPDGPALVLYSVGLTEIATYDAGRRVGDVTLHVLMEGEDLWGVLPADRMSAVNAWEVKLGRAAWEPDPGLNEFKILPRPANPPDMVSIPWAELNRVAAMFDFTQYKDLAAARSALDAAFPSGSKAPALVRVLDTAASEGGRDIVQLYLRPPALFYRRHSSLLVTMPSMGRICVASSRQDLGGGNANLWVYTVIFDDEATVIASETRLFFQDQKFSARGVPLRAENFAESKDFIRAAQAILGPHPSASLLRPTAKPCGATWKENAGGMLVDFGSATRTPAAGQ
jgi:hypothetical protein